MFYEKVYVSQCKFIIIDHLKYKKRLTSRCSLHKSENFTVKCKGLKNIVKRLVIFFFNLLQSILNVISKCNKTGRLNLSVIIIAH